MKWLINYIRSCFCKHEWECLIKDRPIYANGYNNPVKYIWIYRCNKCGCKNKITTD